MVIRLTSDMGVQICTLRIECTNLYTQSTMHLISYEEVWLKKRTFLANPGFSLIPKGDNKKYLRLFQGPEQGNFSTNWAIPFFTCTPPADDKPLSMESD